MIESTHWWSVGMRRIFHVLLGRSLQGSQEKLLLDVGCGTGIWLSELREYGRVVGVDLSQNAVVFSKRRGERFLIVGEASALPFHEGIFDVVTLIDVLEHLDDDVQGLMQCSRVCKPGGTILVNVPAFGILWSDKDVVNGHKRRYQRQELAQVATAAGLQPQRLTYVNILLFFPILLARLIQRMLHFKFHPEAEYVQPPILNTVLKGILSIENLALRIIDFPFGVSLVGVLGKSAKIHAESHH